MQKKMKEIELRILGIKKELQEIGLMRPGTLTEQYKNPKEETGGYYQLSYTHEMKSRTDYIRKPFKDDIKNEVKNYNKFKELCTEWVSLSIKYSKLRMKNIIANK
jgi:hypothetical protein